MLPSSTWKNNDVYPFGAERRRLTRLSAESGGRFIKTRGRENAALRPNDENRRTAVFFLDASQASPWGRLSTKLTDEGQDASVSV